MSTQPSILTSYLQSIRSQENGGWVKGYELYRKDTPWGFLGPAIERRAREMCDPTMHKGWEHYMSLEKREVGGYVEFRYRMQSLPPPIAVGVYRCYKCPRDAVGAAEGKRFCARHEVKQTANSLFT